jgi:hypothetical protein
MFWGVARVVPRWDPKARQELAQSDEPRGLREWGVNYTRAAALKNLSTLNISILLNFVLYVSRKKQLLIRNFHC